MSIESLVNTIEDITNGDELVVTSSIDMGLREAAGLGSVVSLPKRQGRPNIHPWAGRTYLLQDEVVNAFKDPKGFIELMHNTYEVSPERIDELGAAGINVGPSENIEFTLYGAVNKVMDIAKNIEAQYPDNKVIFKISKDKLVPPSSEYYVKPTTEVAGLNGKGKPLSKITWQEFSPDNIYVYVSICPK